MSGGRLSLDIQFRERMSASAASDAPAPEPQQRHGAGRGMKDKPARKAPADRKRDKSPELIQIAKPERREKSPPPAERVVQVRKVEKQERRDKSPPPSPSRDKDKAVAETPPPPETSDSAEVAKHEAHPKAKRACSPCPPKAKRESSPGPPKHRHGCSPCPPRRRRSPKPEKRDKSKGRGCSPFPSKRHKHDKHSDKPHEERSSTPPKAKHEGRGCSPFPSKREHKHDKAEVHPKPKSVSRGCSPCCPGKSPAGTPEPLVHHPPADPTPPKKEHGSPRGSPRSSPTRSSPRQSPRQSRESSPEPPSRRVKTRPASAQKVKRSRSPAWSEDSGHSTRSHRKKAKGRRRQKPGCLTCCRLACCRRRRKKRVRKRKGTPERSVSPDRYEPSPPPRRYHDTPEHVGMRRGLPKKGEDISPTRGHSEERKKERAERRKEHERWLKEKKRGRDRHPPLNKQERAKLELQKRQDKPISFLNCPVCHKMFKFAVEVECGHVFCNKCLHKKMGRAKCCPTCKKEIEYVHPCYVIRELVDKFGARDGSKKLKTDLLQAANFFDSRDPIVVACQYVPGRCKGDHGAFEAADLYKTAKLEDYVSIEEFTETLKTLNEIITSNVTKGFRAFIHSACACIFPSQTSRLISMVEVVLRDCNSRWPETGQFWSVMYLDGDLHKAKVMEKCFLTLRIDPVKAKAYQLFLRAGSPKKDLEIARLRKQNALMSHKMMEMGQNQFIKALSGRKSCSNTCSCLSFVGEYPDTSVISPATLRNLVLHNPESKGYFLAPWNRLRSTSTGPLPMSKEEDAMMKSHLNSVISRSPSPYMGLRTHSSPRSTVRSRKRTSESRSSKSRSSSPDENSPYSQKLPRKKF